MIHNNGGSRYVKKVDLKDELRSYRFDYDLLQKIPCSKSNNKKYKQMLKEGRDLPQDVCRSEYDEFYTVYEADLSQDEINEYLTYKRLSYLRTIKNFAVFFAVLAVVSLIVFIWIAGI